MNYELVWEGNDSSTELTWKQQYRDPRDVVFNKSYSAIKISYKTASLKQYNSAILLNFQVFAMIIKNNCKSKTIVVFQLKSSVVSSR